MISAKNTKNKKKNIVVVSGAFDPLHPGHVRLFQEAKKLGDELVVLLNNDNWLRKKKGYVFMAEKERKEIVEAIKGVDRVILTKHSANPKDMGVMAELKSLKPDVFAKGGDWTESSIPESKMCDEIKCKLVFNVGHGGKIQSSSWLVSNRSKK